MGAFFTSDPPAPFKPFPSEQTLTRHQQTLWNGGDALVRAVAAVHPNVIVVLHTPGPVLFDYAAAHPNVTAIIWAGLPGQESGGSLVDVLYGTVNPQGRSPFTWARSEADYGARVQYTSNVPPPPPGTPPGAGAGPWQTFPEGVFVDYRHFDRAGLDPLWEFGFGLSYTTFRYEDLNVTAVPAPAYTPARGTTAPAPSVGAVNRTTDANVAPSGFARVKGYIYPWVNATFRASPPAAATPARNGSAQPVPPAGGAPGGHRGLYDEVYRVVFTVRNVGAVAGGDVPQLVSPPSFPRWAAFTGLLTPLDRIVRATRRRRQPAGRAARLRRRVPGPGRDAPRGAVAHAPRRQQLGRGGPELGRHAARQDGFRRPQFEACRAERDAAAARGLRRRWRVG